MIPNTKSDHNSRFTKTLKNESGMILLISAAFLLIMSIVVIGVLNRNVTQTMSATEHYKQIQAEQLARGAWWLAHEALYSGAALPSSFTVTQSGGAGVGEQAFTTTYTVTLGTAGPTVAGITPYRVNVTYN